MRGKGDCQKLVYTGNNYGFAHCMYKIMQDSHIACAEGGGEGGGGGGGGGESATPTGLDLSHPHGSWSQPSPQAWVSVTPMGLGLDHQMMSGRVR